MWRRNRNQPAPADDASAATYDVSDPPALPPSTAVAPQPAFDPPLRLRPPGYMLGEAESTAKRLLFHLVALAIVAGYAFLLLSFWAPAPCRPGIDENAYLVGGRMIADHGSPSLEAAHPLSYVGAMWVQSEKSGLYYPKYPAGLSLLYAIPFWLTDPLTAKRAAFLVSPASAVIAAYVTFLLTRRLAGSFPGVLAMLVLATGITTLELAHIPNSHLPCLCVVTVGMYFLVWSVQSGRIRWAILGGFVLGFATSIRYSQGLMALPVAATAIMHLRPSQLRSWLRASTPLLAWAIPVTALATFNWLTMGHLSGYDATRESTGFTVKEFLRKWEFAVDQIYHFGLFFIAPVGLIGLVLMFRRHVKVAILLLLWFLPGTLLYFAYYWGKEVPGVGFLRFFLDLFPALIVAAFWLVRMATRAAAIESPRRGSIAAPLAAGLLCAIPSAHGLWVSLPEMTRQHVGNLNLAYSGERFLARVPEACSADAPRPVVFADEGLFPQFLMYAQFIGDADFYAADAFMPKFGGGFGVLGFKRADKNETPVLIQPLRRDRMDAYYKSKTPRDLVAEQQKVMSDALGAGRPVYLILNAGQREDFLRRFVTPPFTATELERWTEPAGNPPDPGNHPLSPPHWRLNIIINWNPQSRYLYRVTRQSANAATQPVASTPNQ